jgi:predicted glutamine amidotransferase
MCHWLAFSGSPVPLDELLFKPKNSLGHPGKHSQLGATTTNGDGSVSGDTETPGLFRSIEPAWNDRNLLELSGMTSSPRVFAHISASTGSAVQQTNCQPFRLGRWLWMHNGMLSGFPRGATEELREFRPVPART